MARSSKACRAPDCPNLQPCPLHPIKAWSGSKRRSRTVSGWEQQRRARRVIERDAGICYICGKPGADLADHVVPLERGGPDDESNLRACHSRPCHEAKTQREAQGLD